MSFNSIKNLMWLTINRKHFKNWKKRNFFPPSPEFIKHQVLVNNNLSKSLWIETGTYYGDTTNILSKISDKVISIEADKRLMQLAEKKFENKKNVEILLGKSEDLLEKVISENIGYDNICIYLDAHLCNDHLTNNKTFGQENSGTPLKLELEIIEKHLSNFSKVNVLIDDIRLFDKNFQNYTTKNDLINWCNKNNFEWDIQHDILIASFKKLV
jgi:hypothetical protein|tara:strand:- start:37 stop:675 length:639 start_codon:yes stop_codon:yes gene_type:complete